VENNEKLNEIVRIADRNTVLIGDFNAPGVDWRKGESAAKWRGLLDTITEENMEQLVSFSTHVKGNVLDLVVTNCPERVVSISEEGRLGKSDHSILMIELECEVREKKEERKGYNWRKADMAGMREELDRTIWESEISGKNVDEAWNTVADRLH
jgi:hypothetical protein